MKHGAAPKTRMNRRAAFLMVVVLGAMAWYVFRNMGQLAMRNAHRAQQMRIERAVMAVEAAFGGMLDVGYVAWTPASAAAELAKTMTASETLTRRRSFRSSNRQGVQQARRRHTSWESPPAANGEANRVARCLCRSR